MDKLSNKEMRDILGGKRATQATVYFCDCADDTTVNAWCSTDGDCSAVCGGSGRCRQIK